MIYPSKVFLHTGVVEWMGNGHGSTVLTHSLVINIPSSLHPPYLYRGSPQIDYPAALIS